MVAEDNACSFVGFSQGLSVSQQYFPSHNKLATVGFINPEINRRTISMEAYDSLKLYHSYSIHIIMFFCGTFSDWWALCLYRRPGLPAQIRLAAGTNEPTCHRIIMRIATRQTNPNEHKQRARHTLFSLQSSHASLHSRHHLRRRRSQKP